jgi:hypothetical protein
MIHTKTYISYESSRNPVADIEKITQPGQDPKRRMYRSGYENNFELFPIIGVSGNDVKNDIAISKELMGILANRIRRDGWLEDINLGKDEFARTIVGLEEPQYEFGNHGHFKEGAEIVVAHWGDRHTSPVHGHAGGFIHEELLSGKIKVHSYRIIDEGIVKPVRVDIIDKPGTIASLYAAPELDGERRALVHNFISIGRSNTLHFLPEHTRDGRDNRYRVRWFDEGITTEEVKRITSKEGLYLQRGEVVLVRSTNVPEYRDHFIVITGHPVVKEHGLRPQDIAVPVRDDYHPLLDQFEEQMGLTLLQLLPRTRDWFLSFHDIKIENDQVIFPKY